MNILRLPIEEDGWRGEVSTEELIARFSSEIGEEHAHFIGLLRELHALREIRHQVRREINQQLTDLEAGLARQRARVSILEREVFQES